MTGPIPPVNDEHPDNDLTDEDDAIHAGIGPMDGPDREWRVLNGVRFCEDYPACGHEQGDCDGSKYGTDEQIKQRVYDRMRDGDIDEPEGWW